MSRPRMRVLLTEDATPSARQILTVLGWHGHHIEALSTGGLGLTRLSRFLARRHRVVPMGLDPDGYLAGLERVLRREQFDVLLPTHEQVAVLCRHADRLSGLVGTLPVPDFPALARVQDKVAATALLRDLRIAQPQTEVVTDRRGLLRPPWLPCFVKLPVATASRGVWRVTERAELTAIADVPQVRRVLDEGPGLLVQQPLDGELLMVQTVFDSGRLLAGHATVRSRLGVGNAASAKESVAAPELLDELARLGAALGWHGALSADAIQDASGRAHLIDLNPRLVEPVNAELAGVGLLDAMLAPGTARQTVTGRTGVRTSMALMALLRHGETGAGRLAVASELRAAIRRGGPYEHAAEELLGVPGDRAPVLLTAAVAIALLARPGSWRRLTRSAATDALGDESWRRICAAP